MKWVLYRRVSENDTRYFIRTQLEFGEMMNRENESLIPYKREVLAESYDFDLLVQMRELAEGEKE